MAGELRNLLLVDADEPLTGILSDAFHARGVDVSVLSDSEAVTAEIERIAPELVILCAELPSGKGAGYLLCKKIKSEVETQDLPVILISGQATEEDFTRHQKLKHHADAYLRKPFTDEQLFKTVSNLVGFALSNDDFEGLQEQVHEFLAEKDGLESEISTLKDALDKAKRHSESLQKKVDDLTDGASLKQSLESKLEELNSQFEEGESRLHHQKQDMEKVKKQLSELAAEQKHLEEELAHGAKARSELEIEYKESEKKLDNILPKVVEAREEVAKLRAESSGLVEEKKELEKELGRLKKASETLAKLSGKMNDVLERLND